jgi:hypothetical protein
MASRIDSYDRFWVFYLGEHSRAWTRRLHAAGTASGLVCHLLALPLSRSLWWLPAGFVIGYAFAWASHGYVERNRPATLRHPYWSFFADLEMFHFMVLGWMGEELARLAGAAGARASALRVAFRIWLQVAVFGYLALVAVCWALGLVSLDRGLLG